jgi:hypothetical protein
MVVKMAQDFLRHLHFGVGFSRIAVPPSATARKAFFA